jgi:hypothetical protein
MFNRYLAHDDETERDLAHGQVVIVTARWILITTGLFLAIFIPPPLGELRLQIGLILVLAVANFFLQTQVLKRRPILPGVVYATSAADLTVVSLLLLPQGGYDAQLYVLYFPALLALAVAFPPKLTAVYTGATLAVYGVIAAATAPWEAAAAGVIVSRLLALTAVAVCGVVYWRIEHERRSATEQARTALESEIGGRRAGRAAIDAT